MTQLDGFEVLSERHCRMLLGRERVGRIAVSDDRQVTVLPVNYSVVSDELVFFTGEGTKLRAAAARSRVTFEVDRLDPFAQTGWSVMVVGQIREVIEPVVIAGARAAGLRPWAHGDRGHLVALSTEVVSGRRVGHEADLRGHGDPSSLTMVGPHSPVWAVAHLPVRVGAAWSFQSAAQAMREANVSSVLVEPDTAILTERDLTRALSSGLGPNAHVSAVSVHDLVSVDRDATVVEAVSEMLRHEIRHLLVCNHRGEVVGLVSLRDLMRVLLDAMDPAVWTILRQTLSVSSQARATGTFASSAGLLYERG
jgi:CBS domain-containing protein